MILVKVGQDVVDEDIASPVLIPDVLLLDKQCTVALIPQAICVTLVQVCDHILAHLKMNRNFLVPRMRSCASLKGILSSISCHWMSERPGQWAFFPRVPIFTITTWFLMVNPSSGAALLSEENQRHCSSLSPRGYRVLAICCGNTGRTTLWGNCTGEAAGSSFGKVQGDGWGGGDQPALWQIVSHLDAGKCLDALHTAPRCWFSPTRSWWCGVMNLFIPCSIISLRPHILVINVSTLFHAKMLVWDNNILSHIFSQKVSMR